MAAYLPAVGVVAVAGSPEHPPPMVSLAYTPEPSQELGPCVGQGVP